MYAAFLEKNRIYKCLVHTIGIGQAQDQLLLQRIAKDTGGIYRDANRNQGACSKTRPRSRRLT